MVQTGALHKPLAKIHHTVHNMHNRTKLNHTRMLCMWKIHVSYMYSQVNKLIKIQPPRFAHSSWLPFVFSKFCRVVAMLCQHSQLHMATTTELWTWWSCHGCDILQQDVTDNTDTNMHANKHGANQVVAWQINLGLELRSQIRPHSDQDQSFGIYWSSGWNFGVNTSIMPGA